MAENPYEYFPEEREENQLWNWKKITAFLLLSPIWIPCFILFIPAALVVIHFWWSAIEVSRIRTLYEFEADYIFFQYPGKKDPWFLAFRLALSCVYFYAWTNWTWFVISFLYLVLTHDG